MTMTASAFLRRGGNGGQHFGGELSPRDIDRWICCIGRQIFFLGKNLENS